MSIEKGHLIKAVIDGSIADQLGIEPGDRLICIDDEEIEDVLDYRMKVSSEHMTVLVEKNDGEQWEYDIENEYEDLGIEFDSPLMSDYRRCCNGCIFCFIDQMPEGLRETLYFKDDDARLDFLQGNYVTLTNMTDHDVDRIIKYRMEPINISVHTTDPALRCRMMKNKNAGEVLSYIDRFKEAGISMNGQIVLCPGWNDGAELERTLSDMLRWAPCMESISVVPIGLTKYREGLEKIEPVDKNKAIETIEIINKFRQKAIDSGYNHFVHASDELYLLAGFAIPDESEYDGYLQLENGVGMLSLLREEFADAEKSEKNSVSASRRTLVTGVLAEPFLKKLLKKYEFVNVIGIRNDFFGEQITVSGLVTGKDVINQLKGKCLGSVLLLPENMFRDGEEIMLDDITREDIEHELGVPVIITGSSGYDLYKAITMEADR